jgi:hypothetical protein
MLSFGIWSAEAMTVKSKYAVVLTSELLRDNFMHFLLTSNGALQLLLGKDEEPAQRALRALLEAGSFFVYANVDDDSHTFGPKLSIEGNRGYFRCQIPWQHIRYIVENPDRMSFDPKTLGFPMP